jgi:hypothetical protein
MLIPVPLLLALSLPTTSVGSITLPFEWPAGVPSGFSICCQYGIQDEAAVHGVSLSNALQTAAG